MAPVSPLSLTRGAASATPQIPTTKLMGWPAHDGAAYGFGAAGANPYYHGFRTLPGQVQTMLPAPSNPAVFDIIGANHALSPFDAIISPAIPMPVQLNVPGSPLAGPADFASTYKAMLGNGTEDRGMVNDPSLDSAIDEVCGRPPKRNTAQSLQEFNDILGTTPEADGSPKKTDDKAAQPPGQGPAQSAQGAAGEGARGMQRLTQVNQNLAAKRLAEAQARDRLDDAGGGAAAGSAAPAAPGPDLRAEGVKSEQQEATRDNTDLFTRILNEAHSAQHGQTDTTLQADRSSEQLAQRNQEAANQPSPAELNRPAELVQQSINQAQNQPPLFDPHAFDATDNIQR